MSDDGYTPLPTRLDGRVALVTGAARGIGRAICLALAAAGADVAVADIHPEPYRGEAYYRLRSRVSGAEEETSTADAVAAAGSRATTVAIDIADRGAVRAGVEAVVAALGPVDILVNAAGIVNNLAPLAAMRPADWAREIDVNLTGAFHCMQAVLGSMAERGWGRIVSIASVSAVQPGAMQPAYAASKAGLIALTQAAAKEHGDQGITANAVLPGLIATPLVLSMPAHLREGVRNAVPARRLGRPAEVAALVAWLASPAAAFVNGAAIPCDGGLLLGPPTGLAGSPG